MPMLWIVRGLVADCDCYPRGRMVLVSQAMVVH